MTDRLTTRPSPRLEELLASLEGQNHEGPIVGGRRAACVRRDGVEDRIPETLRIRGSLGAKEPLQPLETERFPLRVGRLDESVCHEKETVARREGEDPCRKI